MHVEGLEPGLYHYNSARHELRFLRYGDESRAISEGLVQSSLALDTSLIFFITGIFSRSTFKYGDRGYRFTLIEAGHVAQNLNLAATALGLGCTNIGGFFDRQIDEHLGARRAEPFDDLPGWDRGSPGRLGRDRRVGLISWPIDPE